MFRTMIRWLPKGRPGYCTVKRNAGTYHLPTLKKTLKPAGLFLGTALCREGNIPIDDLRNYEIDMTTWSESESSIMNLMNVLKESIVKVSVEYRKCLRKQMEITLRASEFGHFTDKWDDLPEYRLLGDELKDELNKYSSLIKTIGKIASDANFASVLPKPEESLKMISSRYKQLERVLQKEFEENRRLELELIRIKRDSILRLTH